MIARAVQQRPGTGELVTRALQRPADRDQILSGLTAGEVVVEANMQSLTDGEKVRVLGTG